jgi:hypothetical protein
MPFWSVVIAIGSQYYELVAVYRTHVPPEAAFQAQSSFFQSSRAHAFHMHSTTNMQRAACGLRSPHKWAGRGRSELESPVSFCARVNRPNSYDLMAGLPHTAGSYQFVTCTSVKLHGRVSFAS